MDKQRENWIDIVRGIACFLVLLGHLFQSLAKSNIISENLTFRWFDQSIYLFHVAIFFICSGYLYQRSDIERSLSSHLQNIQSKLLVLGVPYLTFSTITWLLKTYFSADINDAVDNSLLASIFINPISPYWFLYSLFALFVLIPVTKRFREAIFFVLIALLLHIFRGMNSPFWQSNPIIGILADWGMWFVLGMAFCWQRKILKFNRAVFCTSLLFLPLSIFTWQLEMAAPMREIYALLMGLFGCVMILQTAFAIANKIPLALIKFCRKYTLPIFLMHTIFAAGFRIALNKFGILNPAIHIIGGILTSIFVPAAIAWAAEKSKFFYFFINPKAIKRE